MLPGSGRRQVRQLVKELDQLVDPCGWVVPFRAWLLLERFVGPGDVQATCPGEFEGPSEVRLREAVPVKNAPEVVVMRTVAFSPSAPADGMFHQGVGIHPRSDAEDIRTDLTCSAAYPAKGKTF
jgi:hypothetical protein